MRIALLKKFIQHNYPRFTIKKRPVPLPSNGVLWCCGVFGVVCGSVWLEVYLLNNKIRSITDNFHLEATRSPEYVYRPVDLDPFEELTEKEEQYLSSLRKKLKAKLTRFRVKYLSFDLKKEDPFSLLQLTKSSNPRYRKLGIKVLSRQKNWQDHEYRYVAQLCDNRTLVGLARSKDADSRFFPLPPPLQALKRSLEEEYRILLSSMPVSNINQCLQYFTTAALHEGTPGRERESLSTFGGTGLEFTQTISGSTNERKEIIFLRALENHSTDIHHCNEIIKLGGLQVLMHTYNQRQKSIIMCRDIAKILGNLAEHLKHHEEIIKAGWVTVLAQWIKSPDLTLSLNAARALANLDQDFSTSLMRHGIYTISPIYRHSKTFIADVVFVHGLLGGPFKTWRQQDRKASDPGMQSDGTESVRKGTYTFCWPKDWLAKECPNSRLLSVEYNTELSMWNAMCPYECEKRTLQKRASVLVRKLQDAGVGTRPVIWVGHSMGGLLIKEVLSQCRNDPKLRHFVENSRGIIFYSTPHRGSNLAAYSNHASYIVSPTVEVQEMRPDSLMLRTLHKDFQQIAMDYYIPCLSFGETEKTVLGSVKLKMIIVPPESSDPGIGEFHTLPTNHLNVCKPWDENAEVYRRTVDFIQKCTSQTSVQNIIRAGKAYQEMNK